MNSESEQRLSLQELKQRNSQQTALPVQTPPSEARPTKADWARMMNDLDTLWLSAPVIKCKKTPNKKCRFLAERRNK